MEEKSVNRKKYLIIAFLGIVVFVGFLRIFLNADFFDEVINLTAAYRVAIGQLPFYECWESYQTGDYFMALFIWLYNIVKGDTNGIILYARIIYMIILFCMALLVNWAAKELINKEHRAYISAYIMLFQLYGLFYLWYDSLSTLLLLAGTAFLLKYRYKSNVLFAFEAGVCHALMVLAYPSYIVVVIYMIIIQLLNLFSKGNRNNNIKRLFFYSVGGGIIAGFIVIWLLCIEGWTKLFEGLNYLLSLRSFSQMNEKVNIFYWMVKCFFKLNKWLIVPTIVIFFLFVVSYYRMKKEKSYGIFMLAILIIMLIFPLINFYGFVSQAYRGLPSFMAFIGVWAPFFALLVKEKKAKKEAVFIFVFMWVPSVITSFCVAITSIPGEDGPIKCWQGMLGCTISTFLCVLIILKEQNIRFKNLIVSIWFTGVLVITLLMNYSYVYQSNESIFQNKNLIKEGIYAGIWVSDSIKEYATIEPIIEEHSKKYNTIYAGNIYRTAYLMSELRPCTAVIEALYWPLSLKYFKLKGAIPDVIVLDSTEITDEIRTFLNKYYALEINYYWNENVMEIYVINVYKRNGRLDIHNNHNASTHN